MFNTLVEKDEMDKLVDYMEEKHADYDCEVHTRYARGGLQLIVTDSNGEWLWDAICNDMSYGHEDGLLEVMEHTSKNYILTEEERDFDNVLGWLTAQDIIDRLEGKSSE